MTYPCTECILDMLGSMGPQQRQDLRRECRIQAVPYNSLIFADAVDSLVAAGSMVLDSSDEDPFFDLPPSYYESQI